MATKDKFEQSYDLVSKCSDEIGFRYLFTRRERHILKFQDLSSELKSVLSEEYGPLIDALLAEREGADANTINKAIKVITQALPLPVTYTATVHPSR